VKLTTRSAGNLWNVRLSAGAFAIALGQKRRNLTFNSTVFLIEPHDSVKREDTALCARVPPPVTHRIIRPEAYGSAFASGANGVQPLTDFVRSSETYMNTTLS
jgi:hypothetical protein